MNTNVAESVWINLLVYDPCNQPGCMNQDGMGTVYGDGSYEFIHKYL